MYCIPLPTSQTNLRAVKRCGATLQTLARKFVYTLQLPTCIQTFSNHIAPKRKLEINLGRPQRFKRNQRSGEIKLSAILVAKLVQEITRPRLRLLFLKATKPSTINDFKNNALLFFFLRPHLFPATVCGSGCCTGQSPSTRWTRRAKFQGPGMLRKVGELDWKKEGLAGFPLRVGSSWGDWLQRCRDLGCLPCTMRMPHKIVVNGNSKNWFWVVIRRGIDLNHFCAETRSEIRKLIRPMVKV